MEIAAAGQSRSSGGRTATTGVEAEAAEEEAEATATVGEEEEAEAAPPANNHTKGVAADNAVLAVAVRRLTTRGGSGTLRNGEAAEAARKQPMPMQAALRVPRQAETEEAPRTIRHTERHNWCSRKIHS